MKTLIACLLLVLGLDGGDGHGRLMEPPARNCMWRFGYLNPINYNDNEVFCGGVSKQFQDNDGNCGVCGDSYELPHPQPHETGGVYGNAVVSKTYVTGSLIDLDVQLTANHKGRFQFKLCPVRGRQEATQACLDRNIITDEKDGANEFVFAQTKQKLTLSFKGRLPRGLTCQRCVLQWTWRSANSWGNCRNGTSGLGCGPQETFRNCADIKIVPTSKFLPSTDNPRAIYIPDKSGRGRRPLVIRSQVCVATEAYKRFHRMSDWCQVNCLAYPQNCPESICTCLDQCSAQPGYNLTDFDCNKKCLRYPHTEQCPRGCKCSGETQAEEQEFVIIENTVDTRVKPQTSHVFQPQPANVLQPQPTNVFKPQPTNVFKPQPTNVFKPQPTDAFKPQSTNVFKPQSTNLQPLPYVIQPLIRYLNFPILHLPLNTHY